MLQSTPDAVLFHHLHQADMNWKTTFHQHTQAEQWLLEQGCINEVKNTVAQSPSEFSLQI